MGSISETGSPLSGISSMAGFMSELVSGSRMKQSQLYHVDSSLMWWRCHHCGPRKAGCMAAFFEGKMLSSGDAEKPVKLLRGKMVGPRCGCSFIGAVSELEMRTPSIAFKKMMLALVVRSSARDCRQKAGKDSHPTQRTIWTSIAPLSRHRTGFSTGQGTSVLVVTAPITGHSGP